MASAPLGRVSDLSRAASNMATVRTSGCSRRIVRTGSGSRREDLLPESIRSVRLYGAVCLPSAHSGVGRPRLRCLRDVNHEFVVLVLLSDLFIECYLGSIPEPLGNVLGGWVGVEYLLWGMGFEVVFGVRF